MKAMFQIASGSTIEILDAAGCLDFPCTSTKVIPFSSQMSKGLHGSSQTFESRKEFENRPEWSEALLEATEASFFARHPKAGIHARTWSGFCVGIAQGLPPRSLKF